MLEILRRYLETARTYWTGLSRTQQVLVLAVVLSLVAGVATLLVWAGRTEYATLFASLTPEDTGAIVSQLKAAKIPYRVDEASGVVQVPSRQVYETRLKLASQGLPTGGGVGFELFDKTSFGVTDFAQKLNFQRALQGELARTISQLREVQQARVHLVLPQPSLFTERDKPATASVVLRLRPGSQLSGAQVRGIVHLVAGSVEGLTPERVSVIDTAGRILSSGSDRGVSQLTATQLETKAAIEGDLERRVQTMLDSVLGPGKATVRISALVNFDHVERTEERFDPNTVVRNEQRTTEASEGSATNPLGVPGAAANLQAAAAATSTATNKTNRETEVLNYEVSKTVERKLVAPGQIQRLTAAVLVDGAYRTIPTQGGGEQREYVPRKAEDLEKLRRVVMSAVGYSTDRGDEVEVVEIPFDTSAVERERAALEREERDATFARRSMMGGAALALLLVIALAVALGRRRQRAVERLMGQVGFSSRELDMTATKQAMEEAQQEEMLELEGKRKEELRQKVVGMAYQKPGEMAQLLRAWMLKKKAGAT